MYGKEGDERRFCVFTRHDEVHAQEKSAPGPGLVGAFSRDRETASAHLMDQRLRDVDDVPRVGNRLRLE
jgi:hypothetical protein